MSSAIKSAIIKDKPDKGDSIRKEENINTSTSVKHEGACTSAGESSAGVLESSESGVAGTSSGSNTEEPSAGSNKDECLAGGLESGESAVTVVTRTDGVSLEDVIDITDELETKEDVEDISGGVKEDVEDVTDEAEEKSLCGLCLGILQGLCAHDCAQRVSGILFKGVLHLLPQISIFCTLSQNN